MSYNGSGTFVINSTGQPVVTGTVISSTAFNALTADLGTGLSTAITKDGQTATTARIPFAQGISSTLVTDSTSTTTGSIITAGGAGVAKALFVGTTANVAGAVTLQSTLGVTGITTFSAQPIFSSLTASSAVATDASKGLVSVTNTGTGNNVLATSPTLVTPALGTPSALVLTNATGLPQAGLAANVAGNGPAFLATQTSGQSISNSTFTKVQINSEIFDTNNNYDSSTNYRFTATIAGYYQFNANFAFNGSALGFVQGQIFKNGNVIIDGSGTSNNTTIGGKGSAAGVVYLDVADYVEFFVWQSSGGALTLQSGTGANTFSGAMVRAA